jgi:two-component system copper resistance phosphate regulon response regulator CusR
MAPPGATTPDEPGGRPRILVADDEPDTLGLIQLTLETAGFHVDTASNGTQALERAQGDAYDLILLDVMMPDISGLDVLRKLQSDAREVPPIVFLTAKARPEDRRAGEDLGAAAYLIKPTTRGQLLDAVRGALAKGPTRDAGG